MYQSQWFIYLARKYLSSGHYTVMTCVMMNDDPPPPTSKPHLFQIMESEPCRLWALNHIPRSIQANTCDDECAFLVGQCGNLSYFESLLEVKKHDMSFIVGMLRGLVVSMVS
jgi:hypothetical protein